jgi:predicted ATP-grasp superfamily ATP-dependent carboligase
VTGLPTAIVLGVDTPIGLAVVRELGKYGVPVHGVGRRGDAIGRASRWCNGFSVRPDVPMRAWLPALIRRTRARALLAISEEDLMALARLDPVIERCHVLTPRTAPLVTVLDKQQTLAVAEAVGIDTPESWQPIVTDNFALRAATLRYPVILKWANPPTILTRLTAQGLSFEKSELVADAGALLTALHRYDGVAAWPLVQRYVPGMGLGQMFHMANGHATLAFQHRRIHEWPPEGGVSTLCASVPLEHHREQRAKSEAMLARIDWQGPAMVEYRYDVASRRYWLMEINGRFWGSLPLASHSGVHFAWETYRSALFGGIEPQPRIKPRRACYMIPETRRLLQLLLGAKSADPQFRATPWRDLIGYILGFFDPRMRYFVWRFSDPGPFIADMRNIMRKALRRETPSPD